MVGYQDMLETHAAFVDGLKFKGGSASLMPKSFLKEIAQMAHQHGLYLSTGGWAEHVLQKGPSAFKQYIQVNLLGNQNFVFLHLGSIIYMFRSVSFF